MDSSPRVAVIGLGPFGLVTLKNLLEENMNAIGYEKSDMVGGLWNFREDGYTTVLESTVSNISKQRGCFTDFPFREDTPTFPHARDVKQYLQDYADCFGLNPHIHLQTEVLSIEYDQISAQWILSLGSQGHTIKKELFDKVVLATGVNKLPLVPEISGLAKFRGEVLHSSSYKRPDLFKNKNVLIIGFSNSAVDTAETLVDCAKNVYISRRHDMFVFSRFLNGTPFDHGVSYRKGAIFQGVQRAFPTYFGDFLLRQLTNKMQKKSFPKLPNGFNLSMASLITHSPPIISETIISNIFARKVSLVQEVREINDGGKVILEQGHELDIDAIIFCTGYQTDYSLAGPYDATIQQPTAWTSCQGSNLHRVPCLYRNIFSLDHPESLAFIGAIAFPSPSFQIYDLASMALAQVWAGKAHLPSKAVMRAQVERHHTWLASLSRDRTVLPSWVEPGDWMAWAESTAGTGVAQKLGYGVSGWSYWLYHQEMCKLLMDGILSPHIYRLFTKNGRKAWKGARDEILKVNGKQRRCV